MNLDRHIDEIVLLYTVDLMPLGRIGNRFGATNTVIKDLLVRAGVEIRRPGAVAAAVREAPPRLAHFRTTPKDNTVESLDAVEVGALDHANREHVELVRGALRGLGFPALKFRRAA